MQILSSKAAVLEALKRFGITARPSGNFSDRPSSPPFGKRYGNGKLVVDKKETRVIKTIIIPRFNKGDTLTSIVQFLDSKGIPSKNGSSKWHTEKLRLILIREGIYKSKRKPRGSSNSLEKLTKPNKKLERLDLSHEY